MGKCYVSNELGSIFTADAGVLLSAPIYTDDGFDTDCFNEVEYWTECQKQCPEALAKINSALGTAFQYDILSGGIK